MPASIPKCLGAVLLAALATAPAASAWPGLNGYIGFGSNRTGSALSGDVYVTPTDAENAIQLTVRPGDDAQPSFSPDGHRIAFKTVQFGSNQLAVMGADGSGEQLLTNTFHVSEGQPGWSADGTALLYRRTQQNPLVQNADIWLLDISKDPVDLTMPPTRPVLERVGDERYPGYSPDGKRIVFRSGDLVDANGDEEIYVANADGTDVTQLTSNADFDSGPAWSPDGTKIAFERAPGDTLGDPTQTEPEQKDIYVMNADGSDVTRLTDWPGKDEGPAWSPDGTKIAFSSDRDGQQELYVMNADGSDPRRLTDNPARDESPDWQPLPFDTSGHRACGDVSAAPGGASSVVIAGDRSCRSALRLAARWARHADRVGDDDEAAGPPRHVRGIPCDVGDRVYDLTVVHCHDEDLDLGFVWRTPAPASAVAQAPGA